MKTFYFIFITIFLFLVLSISVVSAFPENPISNKLDNQFININYPQAWGFFSIDPRNDNFYLLDSNLNDATKLPHNTLQNYFGLSREGRSHAVEFGMLNSALSAENWTYCQLGIDKCLVEKKEFVFETVIDNTSTKPNFCGEFILVTKEIVPWAWSRSSNGEIDMPGSYAEVSVNCNE